MTAAPSDHLYVGIDIAAATFVAAWTDPDRHPRRPLTFNPTPDGFTAVPQPLAATGIAPAHPLIVLEATGSYWVRLAVALHAAGYGVSVVNPAHVHNYAKALPRRSKTAALDAQLLVQFARERRGLPWTPPPPVYHELRQRRMARAAVIAMRHQARKPAACPPAVAGGGARGYGARGGAHCRSCCADRHVGSGTGDGAGRGRMGDRGGVVG